MNFVERHHKADKKYYNLTKEKKKNKTFLRKYGITLTQLQEMLLKQDYKCLICKEFMKRPVVDHNHETGKVRGLLCHYCNVVLGMAKERQDVLLEAVNYLNRYGSSRSL